MGIRRLCWFPLVILIGICAPMVLGQQNLVSNGDFDANDDGWILIKDSGDAATDPAMYLSGTWDDKVGNTAPGCARLDRLPCTVNTGSYRYYTAWPVTEGKLYQVEAMVKGDINSESGGSRTWFEMSVLFVDELIANDPYIADTDNWSSDYYEVRYGPVSDDLINTETGIFDWTPISELPGEGEVAPAGGFLVPADKNYMLVGFNLGARATDPISSVGEVYVYIDDVVVTACQGNPAGDINGDCKVSLVDLAMFAADWMECNLDPAEACDG